MQQGHTVLVERGAGVVTGYPDADYEQAVCRSAVTAAAYETIEVNGRLPLFEATQSGAENRTPRRCRDNKCPVVMSLAFGQTD